MVYQLRHGVSFCDAGAHLIFLDVEADRYFCLAERAESDLRALIAGEWRGPPPVETIVGLIERGLLVTDGAGSPLAPCEPPASPEKSLLDWTSTPAGLWSTMAATRALARSLVRLRIRRLSGSLQAARTVRPNVRSSDLNRLGRIAASFDRASGWISSQDRCLGQSIAVAKSARRAGIGVDIVIGVALGPFTAHCWVQHGSYVVNDRVETVARYIPILVA